MITQPIVQAINKKEYRTQFDFHYRMPSWLAHDLGFDASVPPTLVVTGMSRYDGASIPWPMWTLLQLHPGGAMHAASLIHDFGYIQKGKISERPKSVHMRYANRMYITGDGAKDIELTRLQLDQLFKFMMRATGHGPLQSHLAYLGVRIFGGKW